MKLPNKQIMPDFSLFSTKEEGLFEPIDIDQHRTRSQQVALNYVLKQSIEFLFGGPRVDQSYLEQVNEICQEHDTHASVSLVGNEENRTKKRKREETIQVESGGSDTPKKFRLHYVEQWDERYDDLIEYQKFHHHCCVPYHFPPNPTLARWVKRQRYQYKLFVTGKHSAMTEQRIEALEKIGFIWDAHDALWERRLIELRAFHAQYGNCNVPRTHRLSKRLSSWVKCQRRQYKMYRKGGPSTLTKHRVEALDQLDFEWEEDSTFSPPADL